jgi:hypothetical protein
VIFIMPGLDNTLLRSSAYFSARSPDMIFDTIKGKNIDLFDTVPGGFRSPLSGSRDGQPTTCALTAAVSPSPDPP